MKNAKENFGKLIDLMRTLRSPQGCAWDIEQTHETLKRYMVEEVYEVIEAIDENDKQKLQEELGDFLFQVIFHCQIASEAGDFTINDVLETLLTKMIDRHPHVFGDKKNIDADAAIKQWNSIKRKEKEGQSVLNGVPITLPALFWAQKVQEKGASVGFDWDRFSDVVAKMKEELEELEEAIELQRTKDTAQSENASLIEEELGDVFFSLVNISRHLDVNAELALRKTVEKFIKRFTYLEDKITKSGKKLQDCSLEEMDVLWEESKRIEE